MTRAKVGRIGLFGGTFDPPHVGHLMLAYSALEKLGLDRVVFIPARRQPLKARSDISSGTHRLEMTRLTAGRDSRLSVDPVELVRDGLSYSVDTVREYRTAHPTAELVFLMGDDAAATLPQWKEPEALAALARLVVLSRGDASDDPPGDSSFGGKLERVATRRIDVSATEIRARVRARLPLRGFVTDDVAAYIAAKKLYRTTTE